MSSSGVKSDALGISGTANQQAQSAYATVNPQYQQLATGTVGYNPQQMADMDTGAMQSLGGGVSAAVGEGALTAGRTNNAGAFSAALDDASRQAGVQQTAVGLGVQNQNAQLEQQNRVLGLQGLSSIYGQGTQDSISALNTANQVQPGFWQNLAAQAGKAAVAGLTAGV